MAWRDSFIVKPTLRSRREEDEDEREGGSGRPTEISETIAEQTNNSLLELERKTHHARRKEDDTIFSGTSFAEASDRSASTGHGFLKHVTFGATWEDNTPEPAEQSESGEDANGGSPVTTKHKSLFSRALGEIPQRTRALSVKYRKSQSAASMNAGGEASNEQQQGGLSRAHSTKLIRENGSSGGGERSTLTNRLRHLSVSMRNGSAKREATSNVTIGDIGNSSNASPEASTATPTSTG